MKLCKNCGEMNSDSAMFCEACGARLDVKTEPSEAMTTEENISGAGENADDTGNIEPIYEAPLYGAPIEPEYTGAAYNEPAYSEPTYTGNAYTEPIYNEPVNEEPTYTEPINEEPAYEAPAPRTVQRTRSTTGGAKRR